MATSPAALPASPNLTSVLNDLCQRADWRRVSQLYLQLAKIKADEPKDFEPPIDITGRLAASLSRTFASYEEAEQQFITDLLQLLATIDGVEGDERDRFRYLYKDLKLNGFTVYAPQGGARRRPKPFEAAVETVRRISDLNRIRDRLETLQTSGVLGGSVSYGRFFNTVGGGPTSKPSDTDLMVVVPDYDLLPSLAEALAEIPFIEAESLAAMRSRIALFPSVRRETETPCLFQHKLRLWDDDNSPNPLRRFQIELNYRLAIHVVSVEDFSYLTLRDVASFSDPPTPNRFVHEYRDDEPPRLKEVHWCFAGYRHLRDLKYEPVEGGYRARLLVCEVRDRRFYPGVHLNLILPQFETRWESPQARIRLALQALRWKLLDRLADERRWRHLEIQKLSLAHSRSSVFAPHVTARVDSA